jgi:amino acid permease
LLLAGESEYWFALIKVLMVIVFILVGLIYDWGGVKGHPGPVGQHLVVGCLALAYKHSRVFLTSTILKLSLVASPASHGHLSTHSIPSVE